MIELVAFLGNFGTEYAETRHNAAWLFASALPYADRFSWSQKFRAEHASADAAQFCEWAGLEPPGGAQERKIHFLKPLTYMNASGQSIGEACRFFRISPQDVLVVHDEIELAPGVLSLKFGGGLGGHNGLRSTKEALGTADFWRIRLGIGKCTDGNVSGYVLGRFSEDEKAVLSQLFPPAAELLEKTLCAREPSRLLGEWAKKKVAAEVVR